MTLSLARAELDQVVGRLLAPFGALLQRAPLRQPFCPGDFGLHFRRAGSSEVDGGLVERPVRGRVHLRRVDAALLARNAISRIARSLSASSVSCPQAVPATKTPSTTNTARIATSLQSRAATMPQQR